jgi:hypothetical protein
MKGQAIPDSDHVGRYCKASTVENGEISATAFMMRETEEYLSVNWLEELKRPSRASQIRDLQKVYNKKLKVGATARIAILNVGTLRSKVQRESPDSRLLRVLHEPEEPDDPSHAGIYEIPHDDEIIAELIAQVVLENHPARA